MPAKHSGKKSEMTALDIHYLVEELKDVVEGGFFRKIYQWKQIDTFQFIFEIYAPKAAHSGYKSSTIRLYSDKHHTYVTSIKPDAPQTPPGFCQFLRKRLIGAKIRGMRQAGFNRIIEMETDEFVLIIENFHHGNVILCDKDRKIVMPLYHQTWKDRTIRPNRQYEYPPSGANPKEIEIGEFTKKIREFGEKAVVFLSVEMGFGSAYSNEILERAGIERDADSKKLAGPEIERLFVEMKEILSAENAKPSIYERMVSPFVMKSINEKPKTKPNFSAVLDSFFTPDLIQTEEKENEKIIDTKRQKIERIVSSQKNAIERMKREAPEKREIGELIYANYQFIQNIINQLLGARDSGLSWNEIKKMLKDSKTEMSKSIESINEKKGTVKLVIDGKKFDIDYKKPLNENATAYFEAAKKTKAKLESAAGALEKSKERLENIENDSIKSEKRRTEKKKQNQKSRWFEKFKWFYTSDGFLVVSGKDAETNEILIKRHTSPEDFVFHSDIQGASFTVIKAEGKEITKTAKDEAAVFAAVQSKAWQRQMGTVDVYGIKPAQVLKVSPDGINLPKGSFYINGERLWYYNTKLEIAIGFYEDPETGRKGTISGPLKSVKAKTKYYVKIRPGSVDATDLTKQIKAEIVPKAKPEDRKWIDRVSAEEIRRLIPSGTGNLA